MAHRHRSQREEEEEGDEVLLGTALGASLATTVARAGSGTAAQSAAGRDAAGRVHSVPLATPGVGLGFGFGLGLDSTGEAPVQSPDPSPGSGTPSVSSSSTAGAARGARVPPSGAEPSEAPVRIDSARVCCPAYATKIYTQPFCIERRVLFGRYRTPNLSPGPRRRRRATCDGRRWRRRRRRSRTVAMRVAASTAGRSAGSRRGFL